MDYLTRIPQPIGPMGFSRHHRHGAGESFGDGGQSRNKSFENGSLDGLGFADILERMKAR